MTPVSFSIFQHTLNAVCKHVKKTALPPRKYQLPIVSHALVMVEGRTVTLVTTDLQDMAHMSAAALVHSGGRFTVPCKVLCDVIRTLPAKDRQKYDVRLDITWDEVTACMTIVSPATRQTIAIKGLAASEWPLSMIPCETTDEAVQTR